MAEKKALRVDVISDTVCPWCFVGKRRLEKAIASRADRYEVEVHFHPFQLNPDMPKEGMERRAYYERRFGSWDHFQQMQANLAQVGLGEGIHFAFDKIERAINTVDSHRLVWFASRHGKGNEAVEALFRAQFEQGRDVSDHAVLQEIGESIGLDAGEVRAFLASDEAADVVVATDRQARQLGVSGVPFFVFGEKWAVSGAQPPEVLAELLDKAAEDAAD